jgi:hypothetical protein
LDSAKNLTLLFSVRGGMPLNPHAILLIGSTIYVIHRRPGITLYFHTCLILLFRAAHFVSATTFVIIIPVALLPTTYDHVSQTGVGGQFFAAEAFAVGRVNGAAFTVWLDDVGHGSRRARVA